MNLIKLIIRKIKPILLSLAVILWIYAGYYSCSEHYKMEQVTIIQKYGGDASGKYSHLEFILVGKTVDGRIHDRYVTASSYASVEVGDKIYFKDRTSILSEFICMVYVIIGLFVMCFFIISDFVDNGKYFTIIKNRLKKIKDWANSDG